MWKQNFRHMEGHYPQVLQAEMFRDEVTQCLQAAFKCFIQKKKKCVCIYTNIHAYIYIHKLGYVSKC